MNEPILKPRGAEIAVTVIIALFVFAGFVGGFFGRQWMGKPGAGTTGAGADAGARADAAAHTTAGAPRRLVIPAIGVDANVEDIGLEKDGSVATPVEWADAGWYKLGPRPGEKGNAVMLGHLDSEKAGAVFWKLHNLVAGNFIYVIDDRGVSHRFRVTKQQTYSLEKAPLTTIFGGAEITASAGATADVGAHLNLITCAGTWLQNQNTYNDRLVVFADAAP